MEIQKTSHTASTNVLAIPTVCTIEEAADILRRKSPTSLYPMLEAGLLKSTVVGGRRLIVGSSIAELLRKGEQESYAPTRVSPKTLHLAAEAAEAAKKNANAGTPHASEQPSPPAARASPDPAVKKMKTADGKQQAAA